MDPPPPYDPRRPPLSHASHPQSYLHSHPQPSSSHSARLPSSAPVPSYYRSRSSSEFPSYSEIHQSQSRRIDGSGKHSRASDVAACGSSDQRDHKRSRVLTSNERNSRAAYDGKSNTSKDQDSNSNYRKNRRSDYDKEGRKNSERNKRTPQKTNDRSKASVWSRIEKKHSSDSPSSSNRSNRSNQAGTDPVCETRPDNEVTGPVIQPVKECDPVQDPIQEKTQTVVLNPVETGEKKKKVVIRRTIVKKSKNNPAGSCGSLADPTKELSGPGSGVRRVKRVIIVKRKKGETSLCNEEEIVRQIANQVFSENKSVDGSKISPEKSVNDIDSKPNLDLGLSDKGILVPVKSTGEKNLSEMKEINADNMAGTSALKVCCAKEEIVETDLNVGSGIYCVDPVREIPSNLEANQENQEGKETAGFSIGTSIEENQENGNIYMNININSLAICDNREVDLALTTHQVENTGDNEESPKDGIRDLNCENLGFEKENNIETEMNDLNNSDLGQNLPPQNFIDPTSPDQLEASSNKGEMNSPDQMEVSSSKATGEESMILHESQDGIIQKYLDEIQKDMYQKQVPVPVPVPVPPKFPATSHLNQKPRNKPWRRDDVMLTQNNSSNNNNNNNQTKMPQSSYIRKGNSLIRSASGNNIPVPPRVPSPNPNPNSTVTSPLHESESETEKLGQGSNLNSKMVYLKKKSNQIVLNSGSSSSDNQSIKSNSNLNSGESRDSVHYSSDSGILNLAKSRIHHKVARHMNKTANLANVWTLKTGTQIMRKSGMIYNYNKSIPSILPWKRTTLLKNSTRKAPILLKSPTSFLIRKLVLARRRDTVYKVSKDGFSICKAGVLSIGGSNLKWSRSTDNDSKKANQEATMAVAEAERKKRETRKHHLNTKSKKGPKASLNLNKLSSSTGYVRVSKGNQLVRDPKKLVRILASEKVQRSLHTLRTRYKRKNKQQYCLFYTRFGFCNKADGKCNYIHDPAKIAICTKFLRGICVNSSCKLTHEIKPERMPDCSYFLLGLCTNLSCPYRHVKVNPNAPVCEGFLRGYCSDGDECRKKHSYTCPQFEKNGECPQGPKCKLYHPKLKSNSKSQSKSRKRNPSNSLQNPVSVRPRYFESSIDSTKEKYVGNLFPHQGQFGDFLVLSSEIDEGESSTGFEEVKFVESESEGSDLEMDDELIKPVRIIRDSGLVVA